MSDLVELKPCPFCGGPAEIVDIDEGENAGGSCVCCTSCLASGNVEFEFKENFVSNWNRRYPDPELSRLSALVAELNRTIERRDRSSETSRKFWIRAAKAALAGDTRELRNRVELAESAPVEIVLSESAPAPPVSQLKDTTNADK